MTARGSFLVATPRVSHDRGIGLVTTPAGLVSVSPDLQTLSEGIREALELRQVGTLAGVAVCVAEWCPKDQLRLYAGDRLAGLVTLSEGG